MATRYRPARYLTWPNETFVILSHSKFQDVAWLPDPLHVIRVTVAAVGHISFIIFTRQACHKQIDGKCLKILILYWEIVFSGIL